MWFVRFCVRLSTDRRQFGPSLAITGCLSAWFTHLLAREWSWFLAPEILFGIVFYTFVEYWYHRWVAHKWFAANVEGHHMSPENYFAAPWFLVAPVAFAVWMLFDTPFTVGVVWTHLWQETVHFAVHHPHRTWFVRLRAHHMYHHASETHNFGHSTTLWDRVFGTYWRTF